MDSVTSSASPTHGPDPSGVTNVALKIDMLVRPWASSQQDSQSSNTDIWDPQPGLLALIEDVVGVRRGTLVLANDLIYVSGFQQASEALVAARQIQIAVQGFRRRHPATPVAVSIAIDASKLAEVSGAGSDGADAPHELVSLLRISKPAQILLTHDVCQQISGSLGTPLKPFPGRFGVHEYLWIAEDQLQVLESEPQLTLAVMTRETPIQHATPAPLPPSGASSATFSAPPTAHLGRSTPQSEISLASRGGLRSPRVWLMVGVPVVVVAIIVGIVLSRGSSHSTAGSTPASQKAAPGSASPAVTVPSASAPAAPVPASRTPASEPPRTEMAKVKKAAPKNEKPAQSKKQPRAADTTPAAAPAPQPAPSTPCMDHASLTQRYNLAEQNRQRGHYNAAERLFREVLACDPSNADARNGLERTLEAEKIHPE